MGACERGVGALAVGASGAESAGGWRGAAARGWHPRQPGLPLCHRKLQCAKSSAAPDPAPVPLARAHSWRRRRPSRCAACWRSGASAAAGASRRPRQVWRTQTGWTWAGRRCSWPGSRCSRQRRRAPAAATARGRAATTASAPRHDEHHGRPAAVLAAARARVMTGGSSPVHPRWPFAPWGSVRACSRSAMSLPPTLQFVSFFNLTFRLNQLAEGRCQHGR